MNRTRIVIAGAAPEAEPAYLILDELGSVVGRGALPVQEASALTPMRTVLVVPGADVLARWIPLKAASEAQARAAARLSLEDELAAGEGAHLALGTAADDGVRLVCVIAASRLQAWLDQAALHGVRPDLVLPDHLCPAPPEEGAALRLADFGDRQALRGWRLAVSGEADLIEAVAGEAALERLSARDLEQDLAAAVQSPQVNLLQGAFDPRREPPLGWCDLRRPALLALALLLSPAVLLGGKVLADNWRAAAAEGRARALAAEILPPGEAAADPVAAVEARLARAGLAAGGGGAGLLAQVYRALEPMDQAQLESFILMPDGAARAAVSLAAYSDLERLSAQLQAAGLTSREEGSREEGGRVVADIVLGGRP